MSIGLAVPGNLLVAGEYAVLEPGGLGLAAAVEPRVRLRIEEARELEIAGSWGAGTARWHAGRAGGNPLFEAVVAACAGREPPRVRVTVDSSAFFDATGRKLGFGSSAAVAAGVAAALRGACSDPRSGPPPAAEVFRLALAAHRRFQGGRGSGYDVAASIHGGTGLYTGGPLPAWRPEPLPWLLGSVVFQGAHSVRTSGATARYGAWKERHPADAREFLEESNRGVLSILASAGRSEALEALARLRELAARLGEAIGVPARIDPPPALRVVEGTCKALGAGNEIGLFVPACPEAQPAGTPLAIAKDGLAWHE